MYVGHHHGHQRSVVEECRSGSYEKHHSPNKRPLTFRSLEKAIEECVHHVRFADGIAENEQQNDDCQLLVGETANGLLRGKYSENREEHDG